jgi:hypothetical protein
MELTLERIVKNAGALGGYCNAMMLHVALKSKMFDEAPAPLEQIIDGTVKLGTDLEPVKNWRSDFVKSWIARQEPVPYVLGNRLVSSFEDSYKAGNPIVPILEAHWLTTLYKGIQSHIAHMNEESKRLAAKCAPPTILVDEGRYHMLAAKKLREAYSAGFHEPATDDIDLAERAGQYMLRVLEGKSNSHIIQLMLGLMADLYITGKDTVVSDGAMWHPAVAKYSLMAMRDMGVLSEIEVLEDGSLSATKRIELDSSNRRVRVNLVWFNALKATNKVDVQLPSQVKDKALVKSAKQQVASWVKAGAFVGKSFTVQEREGSQVLVGEKGNVFGYIAPTQQNLVLSTGAKVTVNVTHDDNDGNIIMFVG